MNDRERELLTIPADLPVPVDDGACDHLRGMRLPDVALESTHGRRVNLSREPNRLLVIYAYPRTGRPDQPISQGWDAIPGARGCTPQNCAYRARSAAFQSLGAAVYGLSTQTPEYQREMAQRLDLPYEVLSDEALHLTRALRLPTVEFGGETLIKRLSMVVRDGVIEHVVYPVFPSDADAPKILEWLHGPGNIGAGA
ncbi:MAG TPA: peroxiredoxin [Vicinamibacterales bacterium]